MYRIYLVNKSSYHTHDRRSGGGGDGSSVASSSNSGGGVSGVGSGDEYRDVCIRLS